MLIRIRCKLLLAIDKVNDEGKLCVNTLKIRIQPLNVDVDPGDKNTDRIQCTPLGDR